MSNLVDLGTSVVLDAHNMIEGMHVEMEGQVLVISKIVNKSQVILRPLTTSELIEYRLVNFWHKHKIVCIIAVVAIVSAILVRWR